MIIRCRRHPYVANLRKRIHVWAGFMLLLDDVDRWRKIDIRVDSHEIFHMLSDQLQNVAAPQLDTFSVGPNACIRVHDPPLRIFMGGSPSLRQLNLQRVDIRCCWPSLTTLGSLYLAEGLSPTPQTTDDFHKMITSMPILTELKLEGYIVDTSDLDILPTIELASLLNLDMRDCNEGIIIPLYTMLSTPTLQSLILRDAQSESMVTSFSSSSSIPKYPQLRNLEFRSCDFSDIPQDGDFLNDFPEVVHVSISECFASNEFGDLLTTHAAAESCSPMRARLPKLRTISFSCDEDYKCDIKGLYDMISTRKYFGLPIITLYAHFGWLLGSEPCTERSHKWLTFNYWKIPKVLCVLWHPFFSCYPLTQNTAVVSLIMSILVSIIHRVYPLWPT
jgi:hypothetical protein